MIPKVVSLFPIKRFEEVNVKLPEGLEFHFENALGEDEIIKVCKEAQFLLVPAANPPITRQILANIPSIWMIQSTGAGYDKIDVDSAAEFGIPVANSPGENADTVAEFTVTLLVALQRKMILADQEVKAGNYITIREQFFRQGLGEIRGTKLGLIGLGAIGKVVAKITSLLGAQVSYYDIQRQEKDIEEALKVQYLSLESLLCSNEVISIHVPLTPKTKGLIGPHELRLMKPGSYIINTSRGEVVDQIALAEALESGHLEGAAIDTVSPEPPPSEHPLLTLSPEAKKKLIITPHIAGITRGALQRMLHGALNNILRVIEGKPPLYVVNGVLKIRKPKEIYLSKN